MSVFKKFADGVFRRRGADRAKAETPEAIVHSAPSARKNAIVATIPPSATTQKARPVSNGRDEHVSGTALVQVTVKTLLYGDYVCMVRSVSPTALFLETADLLPLGTWARVYFGDGLVLIVEVNNHYYLNYADSRGPNARAGMGVRIHKTEIEAKQERRTDAPN